MSDAPRTDIFISHAHADADLARQLTDLLESSLGLPAGRITCTSDEEHALAFGEQLKRQLETRLQSAAVLLLLSTRNSKDKPWVEWECGYAEGHGISLHVLIPGTIDRETIEEPYRDRIAVTLSNGNQVLTFIEQLRRQFPSPASSAPVDAALLARLVHTAHCDELERWEGQVAAEKRDATTRLFTERRKLGGLLLAVSAAALTVAVYLHRDYNSRFGESIRQCEERLIATTRELNADRDAELRRFSLRGRLAVGGNPATRARLEVYRTDDSNQQPLAVDNTDDDGDFSFEEGELTIDPKESVDFVLHTGNGTRRKKVRPLDARLDISFAK